MRNVVSALLLLIVAALPAAAGARKALVIGNANYTGMGMTALKSPVNDAEDVAARLATMGFSTALPARVNLDAPNLRSEIDAFVASLAPGDTVLFYYAGHGIQVNGTNYLWPVDLPLVDEAQVVTEFVSLQRLYDGMRNAKTAANIIVLDACRENPYTGDWTPGLALPRNTPNSSFIAYSTQADDIALDVDVTSGTRTRSPFTNAFIKHMGRTGVPISEVFRDIRNAVESLTGKVPVVENTLSQVFYFRPPVSLSARIDRADDEALVIVNGDERLSFRFNGNKVRQLPLHGGENEVAVKIFNQRSFTGGFPPFGRRPEGWDYEAVFTLPDGSETKFTATENEPEKDGPRHGRLFTAATMTVHVDDEAGVVRITRADNGAWTRDALLDPATPAGVLTDDVRKSLEWATTNNGPADCEQQYLPYVDCLLSGENRACLMRYAAARAREGKEQEALEIAVTTQCHNPPGRAAIQHAGPEVIASWLRQHVPEAVKAANPGS